VAKADDQVVEIGLDGPIGPGVASYVTKSIDEAQRRDVAAIVLRMDTPGGLDTAMREIIQAVLASDVPVIGYVAPSGSRAASAGTYILMACHIAAMAPSTTIGAATPVQIGGAPPSPGPESPTETDQGEGSQERRPGMEDKILNDSVAYMRALAQMRGRNIEWAEKFVTEAASVSDTEALTAGVIEVVAPSVRALLVDVDGMSVEVADKTLVMATAESDVVKVNPDWRDALLALITNPNIAYLLLLIGIYGLIFEFSNPGFGVGGIVGVTALILALYALQLMPVNFAGLVLIVLALGLITAEAFVPSFGVLGVGGIIAFVIGSIFLLDTDVPGFGVSPILVGTASLVSGTVMLVVVTMAVKAWRRPVVSGGEGMVGLTGTVVEWNGREGRVRVHGEIWAAKGEADFEQGDLIKVIARDGLLLEITCA
jgi:membrane-bound serine protease (ClpP class)